ncbi:hypothetical protein [Peribacillus asahii]|uniref:hypothetical protein n=1 Tax=Peribacillus asahii TaxID=228899 RepID=UPI0037F62F4B
MIIEINSKWMLEINDGGYGALKEKLRNGIIQTYQVFVGYDSTVYVSEAGKYNIGYGIIPRTIKAKIRSAFRKYNKDKIGRWKT